MMASVEGKEVYWSVSRDPNKGSTKWDCSGLEKVSSKIRKDRGTLPYLGYYGAVDTRGYVLNYGIGPEEREMGYDGAMDRRTTSTRSLARLSKLYRITQSDNIYSDERQIAKEILTIIEEALTSLLPYEHDFCEFKDHFPTEDEDEGTYGGFFHNDFSLIEEEYKEVFLMGLDIAMRIYQLNPTMNEMALERTPGIVLLDNTGLSDAEYATRMMGLRPLSAAFPSLQFISTMR